MIDTTYQDIDIFIYGNRAIEKLSTVSTQLPTLVDEINAESTASTFYKNFKDTLTSIQAFSSFESVALDTPAAASEPQLSTTEFVTESSSSWLALKDVKLSSDSGLFYGVANSAAAKVSPTVEEILNGKTNTGTTVQNAAVYADTSGASLNFTNLPASTTYTVYFFAKNNDLGPYFKATEVRMSEASTQAVAVFGSMLSAKLLLLVLLISLLLSLM